MAKDTKDKLVCFGKDGSCDDFWPQDVGFEYGLYGDLEDTFFEKLDNNAGAWLDRVGKIKRVGNFYEEKDMMKLKRAWAEFLLFMMLRNPKTMRLFDEAYKKGLPGLTDTEARNITLEFLSKSVKERYIDDLVQFTFCFSDFHKSKQRLIIGDNSVIFKPNNLKAPKCRIILPLGPYHAFIAIRTDEPIVLEPDPTKLVKFINREQAQQANQCIFASYREDVSQRFLENNFYDYRPQEIDLKKLSKIL